MQLSKFIATPTPPTSYGCIPSPLDATGLLHSGELKHLLTPLLEGGGELWPFLRAAAAWLCPAAVVLEGEAREAEGLPAPLLVGMPWACPGAPLPPEKVWVAFSGRGYRERCGVDMLGQASQLAQKAPRHNLWKKERQ